MREFLYFSKWFLQLKILGKKTPFNGAIIINDLCNLNCKHCTVSDRNGKNVGFEQVEKDLKELYNRGIRFLEITGGEPMLYKDGSKTLEDVIEAAKKIGFYRVLLCTNGTLPIKTSADFVWVSVDGDKKTHNKIRGYTYDVVMKNISKSEHKKIFVNFTISKMNYKNLDKAVKDIFSNKNIEGILFHFFIPYIGSSKIGVYNELKNEMIEKIFSLKKIYGSKICNTRSALEHIRKEDWVRPVWGSLIIYDGVVSPCCCRREIVNEEICSKCMSTPAVETYNVQKLNPASALEIFKSFY